MRGGREGKLVEMYCMREESLFNKKKSLKRRFISLAFNFHRFFKSCKRSNKSLKRMTSLAVSHMYKTTLAERIGK